MTRQGEHAPLWTLDDDEDDGIDLHCENCGEPFEGVGRLCPMCQQVKQDIANETACPNCRVPLSNVRNHLACLNPRCSDKNWYDYDGAQLVKIAPAF